MGHRQGILSLIICALTLGSAQIATATTKKAGTTKKAAAAKKPDPAVVASSFQDFCEDWMHKLAERSADNLSHLKWEQVDGAFQAAYVGYEQQHTCKLIEGTEADPVGKVFYREVHYTKRGGTQAEAEQSTPKPTEIFEVQEIFHYLKGKWDF